MIKKEMSFFWGNEKMSWLRYMTLYSFCSLNPTWKATLYYCKPNTIQNKTWADEAEQDFFNYNGEDSADKIRSLGVEIKEWELYSAEGLSMAETAGASHKSNFFKWLLLATDSGFYSDLDVLYVKPMDEYYEKVKEKDAVICWNHGHFSIGFLGSSGNNRFFAEAYRNAFVCMTTKQYQSAGVLNLYNLLSKQQEKHSDSWEVMTRSYPDVSFYNNEMSVVYPWKWDEMDHVFEVEHTSLPASCIGIHWYGGSRQAQKHNNILTAENYQKYTNTIGHFLKGVLDVR